MLTPKPHCDYTRTLHLKGRGAPAGPQRSTMVERQGAAPTYNGGAWAGS
jgi:hypothetical protein